MTSVRTQICVHLAKLLGYADVKPGLNCAWVKGQSNMDVFDPYLDRTRFTDVVLGMISAGWHMEAGDRTVTFFDPMGSLKYSVNGGYSFDEIKTATLEAAARATGWLPEPEELSVDELI